MFARITRLVLCLLVAGALRAAGDTNKFSNIVGFKKLRVLAHPQKLALLSTPFVADNPNINSAIGPQLKGQNSSGSSDNILMWDAAGQKYKMLWIVGDVGYPEYNFKWLDCATGEVATNTDVLPGHGFWVRSRQFFTQTVVVAGSVVNVGSVTTAIVRGYNLLAYPFSSPINLTKTTLTNGAVGGNSSGTSDNILRWDANAQCYVTYFLAGDVGYPEYNWQWMDPKTLEVATNAVLQPGEGFWYRHRGGGFDWVEARPYSVP